MTRFICLLGLLIGQAGETASLLDPNLAMPDKKKTQICVWYVTGCNNDNRIQTPYGPFLKMNKSKILPKENKNGN